MRCRQAREPLLLNERIVSEDGSSCERINLIASPLLVEDSLFLSLPLTEVIGWLELAQGLVGLPEHQRVILTGLVVDEETQQVVADRLGISQQAVHKNKVNAIYKLRDACKLKEG
ncbi:MAG: sigma factor-like helix-turn-helix DNA-binding protein [Bacillota bacterium]